MGIIKQYRDYLRDNPQGYWFKRKLYGWGWVPARWQGWVVLAVFAFYLGFVAAGFTAGVDAGMVSNDAVTTFFAKIAIAVALLLYICYRKGEKPRWQWGMPSDNSKI